LSGGTDSSIVTALATKVSANKINTYSIAVTDGKINEAPYAAAVAKHLDTNHYELPISQTQMLEMVPSFMQVYDEPFTDSSAFPTMLVSKLARQHVTVTLSGDGGDELFGGYGTYLWANRLQNPLLQLAAPFIYVGSKLLNSRYQRAGMLFEKYPVAHFKSHVFSQSQNFFSEKELSQLLVNPVVDLAAINYDFTGRKLNALEQMSLWDIENYLKDDLLVKVDRASMQYSLETRVPLLDHRVVEFALNLSPSLKINGDGTMKYLLKEVLYDYVPKSLLDRPKWGFSIPLVNWLKTDLKWMIDKYCSQGMIEQAGIVHYKKVKEITDRYLGGKADYLYNRIWTLIVLHWFFYEQQ
jgi:asparagine synthase (glutamine-hydrolysing)